MPDDILKDTIEVQVNGSKYEFSIPSYSDEIRVGLKSRDLLRSITGDPTGNLDGIDAQTFYMINTAARFEVLLRRSSAEWPWSAGPGGRPVVDSQKWPKDKVVEALTVGAQFAGELATFRSGGASDRDAISTEAVAGEPNLAPESIRPGPIAA